QPAELARVLLVSRASRPARPRMRGKDTRELRRLDRPGARRTLGLSGPVGGALEPPALDRPRAPRNGRRRVRSAVLALQRIAGVVEGRQLSSTALPAPPHHAPT